MAQVKTCLQVPGCPVGFYFERFISFVLKYGHSKGVWGCSMVQPLLENESPIPSFKQGDPLLGQWNTGPPSTSLYPMTRRKSLSSLCTQICQPLALSFQPGRPYFELSHLPVSPSVASPLINNDPEPFVGGGQSCC